MNNQAIQPKSLRKEILQGADIQGKNSSPGIAGLRVCLPSALIIYAVFSIPIDLEGVSPQCADNLWSQVTPVHPPANVRTADLSRLIKHFKCELYAERKWIKINHRHEGGLTYKQDCSISPN